MAIFKNNPPVVTNGLVLYLDAANPQSYVSGSTTWRDISGTSNNGTLVNEPTFNRDNGGNIVFDGTNDYGVISNSDSLVFGNGDFSVSLWLKFPISSVGEGTPSQWGPIISKGCATNAPAGTWWIAQTSTFSNEVTLNISSTTGGTFVCSIRTIAFTDGWHSVCATRNGGTASIYSDGIFTRNDTTSESNLTSTTPLSICSTFRPSLSAKFVSTSIGNIQIYNRALTPQEVLQNYNATKSRFNLT